MMRTDLMEGSNGMWGQNFRKASTSHELTQVNFIIRRIKYEMVNMKQKNPQLAGAREDMIEPEK